MKPEGRLELTRQLIKNIKKARPSCNLNTSGVLFKVHPPAHYVDIATEHGAQVAIAAIPNSSTLLAVDKQAEKDRRSHGPKLIHTTDTRTSATNEFPSLTNWRRAIETATRSVPSAERVGQQRIQRTALCERIPGGWHIEVSGESLKVRDLIGFCYIDVLLRHPGKRLPNAQVMALVGGTPVHFWEYRETGKFADATELRQHFGTDLDESDEAVQPDVSLGYQVEDLREDGMDPTFRADMRRVLSEKQRALKVAMDSGATSLRAALAEEISSIEGFLSKKLTNAGRPRKLRTAADRTTEAVSAGIRRAIDSLADRAPAIATYFKKTINVTLSGALYLDTETEWSLSPAYFANCELEAFVIESDGQGRPRLSKEFAVEYRDDGKPHLTKISTGK